ncbi:MAG: hypothetical protein D6732_09150 [Methanobacteriota archaeon]|nr:MAG: hypothetical protein D6732_09150 [Euryarchaeota archaeon]
MANIFSPFAFSPPLGLYLALLEEKNINKPQRTQRDREKGIKGVSTQQRSPSPQILYPGFEFFKILLRGVTINQLKQASSFSLCSLW